MRHANAARAPRVRRPLRKKHMSKDTTKPNAADAALNSAEAENGRAGNVDKIRDILFGSQMRDYEKKFLRLEERLGKEAAELREDMKRRFASLETFIKNEVDALSDRLKAEQAERAESAKELTRDLKDSHKAWEKRAGQMDDQSAKAQRELRQHILEESRRLGEDIEARHKSVTTALQREAQELRSLLTDRLALADLFAEVSLRLKNEFKMPEKE
jgi:DNA anti-recombination protein RmuC